MESTEKLHARYTVDVTPKEITVAGKFLRVDNGELDYEFEGPHPKATYRLKEPHLLEGPDGGSYVVSHESSWRRFAKKYLF